MPPFQHLMGIPQIPYTELAVELTYALIVIVLCLFVYFKTKELYELTTHKGIKYFRLAFLFFSIAYFFRFVSLLFVLTLFSDMRLLFLAFMPFSIASSFAILFLTYSTVWKKKQWSTKKELVIFCIIVFIICCAVVLTRSPNIFFISQLALFLTAIITIYTTPHKKGYFPQLRVVYILLFLFWILNLALFGFMHVSVYLKYILYFISTSLFCFIIYKFLKALR